MCRFSKYRARCAVVFYSLILFLLLLGSCATLPSSRKYVGPVFDLKTSEQIGESFSILWEKWTVHFGKATRGGKSLRLSNPFTMTTGQGGGSSEFPLQITATLMDTMLIEAGLQHYAALLEMPPEEREEFRSVYYHRYDPANHLLVWCELSTTWAEIHLDCDRWIIFIEDDAGNQFEPVRILEESQTFGQMKMDRFSGFQPEQERWGWEVHQKTLMLCFPKRDFLENPILSEGLRFLKLVFQLDKDEKTRAEGIWVFKE